MQHHVLEDSAQIQWLHGTTGFMYHKNSSHNKHCAQPSSLTTGRQDPQVFHCSFQGTCLDTEATHLELLGRLLCLSPAVQHSCTASSTSWLPAEAVQVLLHCVASTPLCKFT